MQKFEQIELASAIWIDTTIFHIYSTSKFCIVYSVSAVKTAANYVTCI